MKDYKREIAAYLDGIWDKARLTRIDFHEKLHSSKYICLFGAGQVGQAVAYDLSDAGVKIDFFCDNNDKLWDKYISGTTKCISVNDLEKIKKEVFVLVTTGYFTEVCAQLSRLDFDNYFVVPQLMVRNNTYWNNVDCSSVKENLSNLIDILEDDKSKEVVRVIAGNWFNNSDDRFRFSDIATRDQYFPADIVKLSDDEVFVDAGAFDGDTVRDFLSRVNGRFDRVIAYELDKNCYQRLKDNILLMNGNIKERIHLFNLGLYDENKSIQYIPNSTSSSINSAAGEKGEVVRLSDHQPAGKITFIKMDIEGTEVKALQGAEQIIRSYSPTLAICVYHAPSHLWEIPLYIKGLMPDYKINLRHHTPAEYETVCYAVL